MFIFSVFFLFHSFLLLFTSTHLSTEAPYLLCHYPQPLHSCRQRQSVCIFTRRLFILRHHVNSARAQDLCESTKIYRSYFMKKLFVLTHTHTHATATATATATDCGRCNCIPHTGSNILFALPSVH